MVRPGRPYNSLKEYNKDTYYLKEGAHIEFIGKGSQALGLPELEMNGGLYYNLASGCDAQGDPLTKSAGTEEHRTGFDLTFSPHKSVSLAQFYGDDTQKKEILSAHNDAVRKVADYIEKNLVQFRMSGGKIYETADNIVASHFNHFVSRDLDPQLHSHLVIYNMVQDKNGKWYSLDGDLLHESRLLTEMYHTELAINLKEKGYAVKWEKRGKMTAMRLEGVSDEAIEIHSKRSKAIHKREKELVKEFPNASFEEIRNMAVLDTRVGKKAVNMEEVVLACRAELAAGGIDPDSMGNLKSLKNQKNLEKGIALGNREEQGKTAGDFVSLAIKHITEHEMIFTKNEIMKFALDFSRDKCRTTELERAFYANEELKEIGVLTDRVGGRRTKEIRFTTKELAAEERFAVQLTWEYNKESMVILEKKEVLRLLKVCEKEDGRKYTSGQKSAVVELLAGRRMSAIQGDPGVGKTTLVKAARRILELSGSEYEIIGLAPTGQAAKELNRAAWVESMTVDSFLLDRKKSPDKKIIVIDETSMLGVKKIAALQRAVMDHKVKMCMIGDIKQMQAIDAGNYFGTIQKEGSFFKNVIQMTDRVRQVGEDYIKLVDRVINADAETTFHFMKDKKMIEEHKDPRSRMKAAAEEYIKDPEKSLIVTARNKEARELNEYIRVRMRKESYPGGESRLGKDYWLPTLQKENITKAEASLAFKYDGTMRLVLFQDFDKSFKKGAVLSVGKVDLIGNRLLVKDSRTCKEAWIDPKAEVEKYQVYKEVVLPFAKGEKIIFQKNDKKLGVQNGLFGKVENFDGRNFSVDVGKGQKRKVFNIAEYPFIVHGYAVTTEKSQGASIPANITVWSFKNKGMNTRNSMVVSLTRGIESCKSFVDNIDKLSVQFDQWRKKSSVMETERKVEGERRTQRTSKSTGITF